MQMRSQVCREGLLLSLLLLTTGSEAKWAMIGTEVPVSRLIANVTPYVKQHPDDAQGYYVLGRIHSLAFVQTDGKARVVSKNLNEYIPSKPENAGKSERDLVEFPHQSVLAGSRITGLAQLKAAERAHLLESVRNYQKATQLAPKEGLYWLGLGWMLEQAVSAQAHGGPKPGEISSRAPDWRTQALVAYRHAYELNLAGDLKKTHFGVGPDTNISQEAAEGMLRLYKGQRLTPEQQKEQARLTASVEKMKKIGYAITPIIFPLHGAVPLSQLVDNRRTVRFDLVGDGKHRAWPWVTPETGLLVWDPEHKGHITSGRQLFGSATWWMFWKNGYQALAALDNNHDGELTGRELDGIAVWRDANGNGVCEKGEVLSLSQLGITAIAVQSAGTIEGALSNSTGLRQADGTYLPTYDWTPASK